MALCHNEPFIGEAVMVSTSHCVRPSTYYYLKPTDLNNYRLFPTLSSQCFQSKEELDF